ncbi:MULTISPECIES: ATP-dependent zinc protease family protein [Salinivibrio]|uniref:Ribosomal protein S6 modification protein n=1 Tax=Salinivibrio sharmensis TaxID=390883 RepID=A0ABX3KI72_9GAMM|nr:MULTISPECIES: ATP-dependent zinc protease [Salinivibrio]KKA43387.1 ribosomal protein S6 modification protein [Salinivibrio sp. KP-1]OOE64490.1 ribosomal protein S6 modification protein [Salinivibrio sp. IB868]OOE72837.1 ribosomal protein S6 modification protein [Salinivibrio sp. IB870]OOE73367.1 ribosomal protein S6 modification protein [Salinivibrio sp. ML290]OOE77932.1 ribosomal protein S6 modification protein [Salinivibrio sp. ML198]
MPVQSTEKVCVGWREWISLPDLDIARIKAKIDTGARTSCLHTFKIEEFEKGGAAWVRFWIHPHQGDDEHVIQAEAPVLARRVVRDSGGHEQLRYVIQTTLKAGELCYPIEMTLTARDNMRFRMLLGRTAMTGNVIVDPMHSFLLGK